MNPAIDEQKDLWDYHDKGAFVVITTNCMTRGDGTAVMGGGLAKQAADRFPELPALYGEKLRNREYYFEYNRIICLPTKIDWRDPSTIDLVKDGIEWLKRFATWHKEQIVVPPLGCGLGGLLWEEVKPLLIEAFPGEQFIILDPIEGISAKHNS